MNLPSDIDKLVQRHAAGTITRAEMDTLEAWLREDASHIEWFASYGLVEQGLLTIGRESTANDLMGALAEIEAAAPPVELVDLTDELKQREQHKRRQGVAQKRCPQSERSKPEQARVFVIPQPVVWLAAAAAIGVLASVVWVSQPAKDTAPAPPPVVAREKPSRATSADPIQVATVTGSLDARLADGRAVAPGMPVFDRPFDLIEGVARLTLTNGVTLTLEGPARLDLGSDMFVELDHGKLVGRVPEPAQGFVVRTPTMDVVDLGTEFAIDTDTHRGSAVHVLEGSIRLESGRHAERFEPVVAEAGHAWVVAQAGTPLAVDPKPYRFYRRVPDAYERAVRDSDPLLYWRFCPDADAEFVADEASSQARLPVGAGMSFRDDTPLRQAPNDRALWLGAQTAGTDVQQSPPLDVSRAFMIEAWIWVSSQTDRRMRMFSNNAASEGRAGFGMGVSGEPSDGGAEAPVLMFTGYDNFDAFSLAPVPTDRWAYVAVAIDDTGALKMWIDGEPAAFTLSNIAGPTVQVEVAPTSGPLRIGDAAIPDDGWKSEHWTGGIDELAVYRRVLTPEEVASRMTRSRPLN